MVSHLLVIGETQSGKSHYANKFHMGSEGTFSVYFNTNHTPYIWGVKVHSMNELVSAARAGVTKINFIPHRGMTKEDWARTSLQLQEVLGFFDKLWSADSDRWGRILIDEAQNFKLESQHATTMLLGKKVQVVVITQYPVMVDTTSRSNMPVWVIFRTGFQMEKFFQGFGDLFPRDMILQHTGQPWHYVSYSRNHGGWRRHTPC